MVDIINTLSGNVPMALIIAIVIGLFRNILGWAENALQDGQITPYEWKMLGTTIVKYFSYVMVLMVGLPLDQAIVAAFALDAVKSSINNINVTPVTPASVQPQPIASTVTK